MNKNLTISLLGLSLLLCSCSTVDNKIQRYNTNKLRYGNFYTLNTLFENELLTHEDLLKIAYFNNNYDDPCGTNYNENYQIDTLDKDIENKANEDLYIFYKNDSNENVNYNNISIRKYCGLYNGYYAIAFKYIESGFMVITEKTIDDVVFQYPSSSSLEVLMYKI